MDSQAFYHPHRRQRVTALPDVSAFRRSASPCRQYGMDSQAFYHPHRRQRVTALPGVSAFRRSASPCRQAGFATCKRWRFVWRQRVAALLLSGFIFPHKTMNRRDCWKRSFRNVDYNELKSDPIIAW